MISISTRKTIFELALLVFSATASAASSGSAKVDLRNGWQIQRAASVRETGQQLSSPECQPVDWYPTEVPATVMAALVANNVYANPFFGENLRSIPGEQYTVGANFSNLPMSPDSAFRDGWWYRTNFVVPADYKAKSIHLHFEGINYRANIWLNGKQIADSKSIAGSWRLFDLDITSSARPGQQNGLAVEVFPPTPQDLAITFVDWNPAPPDKGMGLWRSVSVFATGPVSIQFPAVFTTFDSPSLETARLIATGELHNNTDQSVSAKLTGTIESVTFSKQVTVPPRFTQVVTFTPEEYPQLVFKHPRVWWPAKLGQQNLYTLNMKVEANGSTSDQSSNRFGVRQVTSELTGPDNTSRLFKINGRNILIRGGGYTFDMFLRESHENAEKHLQYVRDLNLNTIRLEGKMVDDDFLDLADQYGVLITTGWSCCDQWEHWDRWNDEDHQIAAESLKDQIRRLRSHPSVINWMNGSDNPPPPDVERTYIEILKREQWPNPFESSATARPTSVTGNSGVKMTGPYDWVPPIYWTADTKYGGAHGFNTETSPGPAVPPKNSIEAMLPPEHRWPVDSWWDYHAGGGAFRTIDRYRKALDLRYGKATSLEDFDWKSQLTAYEGERAMFEAYSGNKYTSTGVVQWMLNNAWPSVIWHLYDYYWRPGGGYFGTKKACEPLHIQYSYADHSVAVVNSLSTAFHGLTATTRVLNLDSTEKYSHTAQLDVDADGVRRLETIPAIDGLSSTYFVYLTLSEQSGETVSSNLYWLSTKPETLDWDSTTWYYTPAKTFADLSALRELPKVDVKVSAVRSEARGGENTTVTVANPSKTLAFFVHLKVSKPHSDPAGDAPTELAEVLPVLWEDNYLTLLPGETRQVKASYQSGKPDEAPVVEVEGWNVNKVSVQIKATP